MGIHITLNLRTSLWVFRPLPLGATHCGLPHRPLRGLDLGGGVLGVLNLEN